MDDAGVVVEVRGDKAKGLLALVGLRPGEVVSSWRLVEELWGDREIRDPLNAVQVLVSKLRRALSSVSGDGRQLVTTSGSGYRLDVDPHVVDAIRFDRLTAEGRRVLGVGLAEEAAVILREALGLWRGRALDDFDE